ncbi:MAG: HdeA/HdeB family chaperone [Sphingomonas bacterium]|nr:HdeA/HdeB family chaperone [Sphingomonas bacterium]
MNKIALSLVAAGTIAAGTIAGVSIADAQSKPRVVEKASVAGPDGMMSKVELLKAGKRLETISCRDYNALDEIYRPQAVVYAANFGPKGKAHPTITTDGVENIIPVVTASCRARPGDHFTMAVKRAMKPA